MTSIAWKEVCSGHRRGRGPSPADDLLRCVADSVHDEAIELVWVSEDDHLP